MSARQHMRTPIITHSSIAPTSFQGKDISFSSRESKVIHFTFFSLVCIHSVKYCTIWVILVSLEKHFFFFKYGPPSKMVKVNDFVCYSTTRHSLQVCAIVDSLMPVSLQRQKSIPCPFHSSALPFFSIKVTPRASLCQSSHCLVINSCSKPVLAPCDSTANIGIMFLITFLPLKCHRGGHVCLQLALPQCEDIIYLL